MQLSVSNIIACAKRIHPFCPLKDAPQAEELRKLNLELETVLVELYTQVKDKCPWFFREDGSGGTRLGWSIQKVLDDVERERRKQATLNNTPPPSGK